MKQQELLKRISIINVKNKLNLNEIISKKNIIYVRCPFCSEVEGTMKLNTDNNSYVCDNCQESGYSISLYAKCKHISNKSAYQELITQEACINNNLLTTLVTNTRKNDEELDIVYRAFLDKLDLSSDHIMTLLKYGFSMDDIEKIGFKTIPTDDNVKINICRQLESENIDLRGTPGFYKDKQFRWNFKSHKGIFIPIIEKCKITSLRIHLDNEYNNNTTNIWFSSSQEYDGAKTNNRIMILYPKENRLQLINDVNSKKDIIIASDFILAYKIASYLKNNIVIRYS